MQKHTLFAGQRDAVTAANHLGSDAQAVLTHFGWFNMYSHWYKVVFSCRLFIDLFIALSLD